MKRKVLLLVLSSTLLISLTACGGSTPEKTVTPDEPEPVNVEQEKVEPTKADNEEAQEDDNTSLHILYQATYDGATTYESESLNDQLGKEVRDLKILAGSGSFAKLPNNYAEDYKAWRIENCGTSFKQAESTSEAISSNDTSGSTDEENYAEVDRILAEMMEGLEGYDETKPEVVIGATEEDIKENEYTGDDGGYDEGTDYDPNLDDTPEMDPELEAKLAALGADSSPSELSPYRSNFTEEEIQQMIEDAYDTIYKVNGT